MCVAINPITGSSPNPTVGSTVGAQGGSYGYDTGKSVRAGHVSPVCHIQEAAVRAPGRFRSWQSRFAGVLRSVEDFDLGVSGFAS